MNILNLCLLEMMPLVREETSFLFSLVNKGCFFSALFSLVELH